VHEILKQQLLKHFGSLDKVPEELKPLLETVSQTYAGSELKPPSPVGNAARQVTATRTGGTLANREYTFARPETEPAPREPGPLGELVPRRNGDAPSNLAMPIQLRGQIMGALKLDFANPDAAEETRPLVKQITDRLAIAMDNARLFAETQTSLNRTDALLRVSRAAISSENIPTLLHAVAETIAEVLPADRVTIITFDTEKEQASNLIAAGRGAANVVTDVPYSELLEGLSGWVLRERVPAISPADRPDPREGKQAQKRRRETNSGAIVVIPVISRGRITATITAINTPEQPGFSEADADLLLAMASQIATAMENARLVAEQRARVQELTTLFSGSQTFSTAPTNLKAAAETIADYFMEIMGADEVSVALRNARNRTLHYLIDVDRRSGKKVVNQDPSHWDYHFSEYLQTEEILESRLPTALRLDDPATAEQERDFMLADGYQIHVIIPLVSKGQPIGIVEAEFVDAQVTITPEQLNLFSTLANQAGAVLENIQLIEAQEQRALELQTAAEVSRAASSILNPNVLLPQSVELIQERFNLYYAGIFLVDDSEEWAVLRAGTGEAGRIQLERHHQLKLGGESMIGRCIASGEAQIALDVGDAAMRFQNPVLPETRSEMALPLISRGRTLGAMTIQSIRAAAFDQENINTLQTMADQLANAIENARLFAQAQLQNVELDTLNEMGRELTALLDQENILDSIYKYSSRLIDFTSFLMAFYHADTDELSFPFVQEDEERLQIARRPLGDGLAAYIVRNEVPLLIPEDLPGHAQSLGISFVTVGAPTLSWLGVPIFVGGEIYGVISVQTTTTPLLYGERHRDLLISIANQAANAIQILALFERAQQQNEELATLNEMSRALSSQLNIDGVLEQVYQFGARLLGTPNGFIALYDEASQMIDFKIAVTDEQKRLQIPSRKLGNGMTDYVIRSSQPLLFKEDVQREMDEMGLTGVTIGNPALSWLAVPIILGTRVIGVIGTQSVTTPRKFNERHRDILVSVAGQAAITLQNVSLFEQAQRQNEELSVLNEMSRELSTLLETPHIVENVYAYTSRLIGVLDVFIALYAEDTGTVSFPYVVDDGVRIEIPAHPLGEGLTDYVIRTRQPLFFSENADQQSKNLVKDMLTIGDPPESWLGVPILLGERCLGMIGTQSVREPRRYTQRHIDLLTSIAGQAAIALQNASLFAQAQQQTEDLATLNELSRALATLVDIGQIAETVLTFTDRLMDAGNFYMAFHDPARGMLSFPLVTIGGSGNRIQLEPRALRNGMTDYVIRNRKALLIETFSLDILAGLGIEMMLYANDNPAKSWLGVPLLLGGDAVGVISVQSTETAGLYGKRQLDLLTAVANQTVTAVQNARSFQQTQRQAAELADLNELARLLSQTLDEGEIIQHIHQFTSRLLAAENFYLALYDSEVDEIEFKLYTDAGQVVTLKEPRRQSGHGMTEHVIRSGKSLLVETDVNERLSELGIEGVGKEAASWLGVPMKTGNVVLGVISVQNYATPGQFGARDETLLTAIASQAAISLQNARSFEQANRQSQELAVLNEMGRELTTKLDTQQVVETVYEYTSRLMDTTSFFVAFFNEASEVISFPIVYTSGKRFEGLESRTLGKGMTDYVIRSKKPLLITKFSLEEIEALGIELILFANNKPAQSWLGVPILLGGQVLGAICMQSVIVAGLYREHHRDLLTSISNQAANAIQNARLFGQTEQQNADLSVLNEMSRVLSSSLSVQNVVDSVYEYTSKVLDTSIFHLILYDQIAGTISYPLVMNLGRKLELADRPFGNRGLTEHVINTRQALLLEKDVPTRMEQLGLETVFLGDQEIPLCWMGVPMGIGANVIGTIALQSVTTPELFGTYERDLLTSIAGQAAIAIQNARLFEQTQQQLADLTTIQKTMANLTTTIDLDSMVQTLLPQLLTAANADVISLYLIEGDEGVRVGTYPGDEGEQAMGISERLSLDESELIRATVETGKPDQARISDPRINPKTRAGFKKSGITALAVIPLIERDNVIGFFYIGSGSAGGEFSQHDMGLLETLSSQAAIGIQNAQLFEQTQSALSNSTEQARRLAMLNQLSTELSLAEGLADVFDRTVRSSVEIFKADRISIATLEEGELEIRAVAGERPELAIGNRLPIAGTANEVAIRENRVQINPETGQTRSGAIRSFMVAPLSVQGRIIGTLNVGSTEPRHYENQDEALLVQLVAIVGAVITNRQLFELAEQRAAEALQRSDELATVNRIVSQVSEAFDLRQSLQIVADELGRAIEVARVGIALMNEDGDSLTVIVDYSADPAVPNAIGLQIPVEGNESTQWVLQNRKSLFIKDAQNDPIISALHEPFRKRGIKSLVIMPLLARNEVIGTVGLDILEEGREFTAIQLRLAETILLQAANAIQNARLFDETRKRAAQLQTAAEVARDASQSLNLDELLPRAVNFIRDRFGFYHASIFLLDDSREHAYVRASTGEAGLELIRRQHTLAVGSQSIMGTVAFTGEALVVNDVSRDPIHRPNPLLPETRAELGMPLKVGGRIIGILDVQSTQVNAFSQDDLSVLQILADQIAVAADNSRTFALAQEAFSEARTRVQELTTLFAVSQALNSAPLQPKEIAETTVETLSRALGGATSCSLSILEPQTGNMHTYADWSRATGGEYSFHLNPEVYDFNLADFPLTRRVMDNIQPSLIQFDDENADPSELAYMKSVGAKTLLILPLAAKGQAFGIVEMDSWDQKREYTDEQLNLALTIANQAAAVLDNALLYEEQLRTAEQLRELDKLKNQFLANMSHELRTPLNSIIGFSRVILKGIDGPVSDLQQQDLTAIYNAGQHQLGLINDILDLSRIEAGKMELNFEELNLDTLITSMLSTARGLVKEKPIQLEKTIEPDLPMVYADATRIRQILLNLLQNAAKFTEEGYIHVRATVEVNKNNQRYVRVSVEDSGIGIAPEDQAKLFQPFSQVDSSTTRKVGGTGLGLSISRNLIELHSGEINVISEVGHGSTFYFTLPIRAERTVVDVEGDRKLVLSIDDDPRVIELYERYLNSQGYQVIPLHDPTRAVEQALELKPFAITLDVMMPNQNGWQVIQELKSNPETSHIPVIFCTIIEDQAKGFSLGAADYLLKPILEEDLINALSKIETRRKVHSILVIDDSLDDLRLVELMLKEIGNYNVLLAEGGQPGLDAMRQSPPDLIILDLSMPELDGFKILEAMQLEDRLRDIPVIVLTGQDLNADQHKFISSHAKNLLLKGNLEEKKLRSSVEQQLNGND